MQTLSQFDLTGKRALITGSTQGVGLALARGMAGAGASVVLNGRNPDKLEQAVAGLRAEGLRAEGLCFDVTNEHSVTSALNPGWLAENELHILVNNAGIVRRTPLAELSLTEWNEVLTTDLTSAFLVTRAVVAGMRHRKQGKIINICSLMSELARETVGAYAAAKGGLKMLTRSMATEWAADNIQTNGIGPGFIATDINTAYRIPGSPLNEFIVSRTPANRWGNAEDLVGAAVFLASAASDFVNGQIIYVDGGLLATVGRPPQ